jgi:hypothetical protein
LRSASDYERLRRAWLPDRIRLLLIGETPPPNGKRFFYDPASDRAPQLLLATVKALLPEEYSHFPRERIAEALADLRGIGVYLVDCLPAPKTWTGSRVPEAARDKAEKWLAKQLAELVEEGRVMIKGPKSARTQVGIVASSLKWTAKSVIDALGWSSLTTVSMLPFPRHDCRGYRAGLEALLKEGPREAAR